MKQFILSIFIIFISASDVLAMPDNLYNEKNQNPIVYDVTYNVNLRNKLEADFDKKYLVREGNKSIYTSKFGAYGREVIVPYDLNKKPDDYKIISK